MSCSKTPSPALCGVPDRKRIISEGTGESPEAKKLNFSKSPTCEATNTKMTDVVMPSDDATATQWCKATFSKMNEMCEMYKGLQESLKYFASEVKANTEVLMEVQGDIKTLEDRVSVLENQNMELQIQNKHLKEENLRNDIKKREKNLIFDGISDTYKEDNCFLYQKLINVLNSMETFCKQANRVQISRLQRLGPYKKDKTRPVLCEFVKFNDVQLILQNRGQLPRNVYAKEDYPVEIENRRRVLRPIFNVARNLEKYKGKCRLVADKLIILGQTFTVAPIRNLDKLPSDLDPIKTAQKEDENSLAFFTRASPFSNFHDAPFQLKGKMYQCVEQYIQSQKALLFNDEVAYNRIMNATEPYEMKKEGRSVKNFIVQQWEQHAERIAFEGCLSKFEQSNSLKEILLSTNDKELIEASKDLFWGAGLTLDSKDILRKNAGTGLNVLGKVLMRVRETLDEDGSDSDSVTQISTLV